MKPYREEIEKTDAEGDYIDRVSLLWNVLNYVILEYKRIYPQWYFIKHGTLARNPVENYRKMFDYLELDFNPEIEQYIVEYTSKKNPVEAKSNEYQPKDAEKTVEAWRNRLTEEEIDRVKAATSEIFEELYPNKEFK